MKDGYVVIQYGAKQWQVADYGNGYDDDTSCSDGYAGRGGFGNGYGNGNCFGNGFGNGDGDGDGINYGSGNGYGTGSGDGCGTDEGVSHGDGDGDGDEDGGGYYDGDNNVLIDPISLSPLKFWWKGQPLTFWEAWGLASKTERKHLIFYLGME